MTLALTIRDKLEKRFHPICLDVKDESHLHHGHAGARPGGETHFRVTIVAKAFEGLSRLDRQRLVYDTLSGELSGGVHALAIKAKSPNEESASAP